MMFSKEQFTTVTPLSKALAMIVFVVLPFAAFFLGMNYGKQTIRPIELIVIPRTENVEEADTSVTVEESTESTNNCGGKPEFSQFLGIDPEEMQFYDPSRQELDAFNALLEEWSNCVETLDWQTYRNEEAGFQVKYPSSVIPTPFDINPIVRNYEPNESDLACFNSASADSYGQFRCDYSFHRDSLDGRTHEEWMADFFSTPKEYWNDVMSIEQWRTFGEIAWFYAAGDGIGCGVAAYSALDASNEFVYYYSSPDLGCEEGKRSAQQIISTFEFIE